MNSGGTWIKSLAVNAAMLAGATAAGTLVSLAAVRYGEVDHRVMGPLPVPLSIALSFLLFACFLSVYYRKRLIEKLDSVIPPEERGIRLLFLLVLAATGYEAVRMFLFRFIDFWPTDLPSYHYAGAALLERLDPYNTDTLGDLAGRRVLPYVYPPLLAILWMPLAKLPLEVVHVIFQILSLIALFACIKTALDLTGAEKPLSWAFAAGCALLFTMGQSVYVNIHHGAISIFITLLIFLFFKRLHEGGDISAGALLALACGIKALPVLLLLYLLIKKRYRALGSALVTGAVLLGASILIVGWEIHWRFIADVAPQLSFSSHSNLGYDAVFHPENQSINGFMSRVVCGGNTVCPWIIGVMCIAVLIPVAWMAGRRRSTGAAESCAVIMALLLVSPITWFHHQILLILPAVFLAVMFAENKLRPGWWILILLAFLANQAKDSGRPVFAVKLFFPWQNVRFFSLVFLYFVILAVWKKTVPAEDAVDGNPSS